MAAGADLLPAQVRTLLATPLVERGEHLGQLVKLTNALAAEFFGALSEAQHLELARLWHFRCFASGEDICSASEECEFLFVVLAGTCELYERRVAHLDELSGTDGHKRHVVARRGYAFGHYPLVHSLRTYDYSARVVDGGGCCMLLIPKVAYIRTLRTKVERHMLDTVAQLQANALFSHWSRPALCRLFFWFTHRRCEKGEDIITQGDAADFCFIIRAGSCNVLVAADPSHAADPSPAANAGHDATGGTSAMGSPPCKSSPESLSPREPQLAATHSPPSSLQKFRSAGRMGAMISAIMSYRHVATLHPGAMVGEIALIAGDRTKRNATIRAASRVELLVLDKDSFLGKIQCVDSAYACAIRAAGTAHVRALLPAQAWTRQP